MALAHAAEGAHHGGAVLALPVDAHEQVARQAPVARRELRRRVILSEPDHEHALGVDAVAAGDALSRPVRARAAGASQRVDPALARGIALDVRRRQALQVRPRVAERLRDGRVLVGDEPLCRRQQHLAAALHDPVERAALRQLPAHHAVARGDRRTSELRGAVRARSRRARVAEIARTQARADAAQVCQPAHARRQRPAQRDRFGDDLAHRLQHGAGGAGVRLHVARVERRGDADPQRE